MSDNKKNEIVETIQSMNAILENALKAKEALGRDIEVRKAEVEGLLKTRAVLSTEVEKLGKDKDLGSQLAEMDRDIFLLQEKNRDLEAENQTQESSMKSLMLALDASKESASQIEATKEDLWKRVQSVQEERDVLFGTKEKLEKCVNERDMALKKLEHIEAKLQSVLIENNTIKLNIDSTRQVIEDLKDTVKGKEKAWEDIQRTLLREKSEAAELKDDKRIWSEKTGSLESQLEIALRTKTKLEKEIVPLKEAIDAVSGERNRLKEKILELEEKAKPTKEFVAEIENLKV